MMRALLLLTLLIAMLAGLTGGCASSKIAMTPQVTMAAVPVENNTFYSVQKVALGTTSSDTLGGNQFLLPKDWKGDGFTRQFTRLAEERYPALFRKDGIPIAVRIDIAQEVHQGAALGVYLCTLCIVGGIFPSVPWENVWHIEVEVEDARGTPALSAAVQAKHRGWWTILSPFGLINIPGESDAPKVSSVGTAGPGSVPEEIRAYVTQCMVDLLAAELLKRDPSIPWAQSPASDAPAAQPATPTILPPPAESVVPF